MTPRKLAAALALGCFLASPLVLAGAKWHIPITLDTTARVAYGSAGTTRNSANSVEYIGCSTLGTETYTGVMCEVTDKNGRYATCWTDNPYVAAAGQGMSPDAYFYFTWDAGGRCTYLFVSTISAHELRAP